ncbi:GNAT family N-acetyltransferase [Thioalkalivibrio sp. ALgr3]|uniref:GNAT family N-acetyltransferase n=1 Tax=Thioalkalivibrio sp. ALgr3 TaxID=1239292 RepID=UPI000476FEE7|nr:GNAT family N-acetyltransferase [Thioalkalivibrio sp. ALgr3]
MIRRATIADATGIAQVHVESWKAIYRGHLPEEYLDSLSPERRARSWQQALSQGTVEIAVSDTGSEITGFVSLAPSRDEDADDATGELTAIYLEPSIWHQGIGRDLMDWAKAAAVRRGWDKLTLWVLEGNTRARDFYAATGWRLEGSTKNDSIGGLQVVEVRYVWHQKA